MINGTLVEGVDWSGKTTLIDKLYGDLNKLNTRVKKNKYYLTDNKITNYLVNQGDSLDVGEEQDVLFTLATLFDIQSFEQENTYILQDRHWLSIHAHNKFFYPNSYIAKADMLKHNHLEFKYNIYLTSDLEEKVKRIQNQPPESGFDKYLAENPHIHQSYDKFWINEIPSNENWLIIDTTDKSKEQVEEESLRFILD